MFLKKTLLVAAIACCAPAAYAAEGDACDPATFVPSCDPAAANTWILCGAQNQGDPNTELHIDCTTDLTTDPAPDLTCAVPACTGTCPDGLASCVGGAADALCQVAVGLIFDGADAFILGCGPGLSCTLGQTGDACAAAPATPCTESGTSCDGDTLVLCGGGDGYALTDPLGVVDCTGLGATCKTDAASGFTGCFGTADALCSVGGFVAVCDDGFDCVEDTTNPGIGACAASTAGEGEGEGDGGEGEGEGEGEGDTRDDESASGSSSACGAAGSGSAVVALGMLLALRRRRV